MGSSDTRYKLVRRKFDFNKDYGTIKSWWQRYKSDIPKPEYLPPTGLIVEIDREPAACGFIYKTDSAFCIFEWFVANPQIDKEKRDIALEYLIDSVVEWSKKAGYSIIYTSVKSNKFVKRLQEKDFVVIDNNMKHMFYGVDNG